MQDLTLEQLLTLLFLMSMSYFLIVGFIILLAMAAWNFMKYLKENDRKYAVNAMIMAVAAVFNAILWHYIG